MRNLQGVVMPDEGKLDVDCVQGSAHAVTVVMAAVATSALATPAVATPAVATPAVAYPSHRPTPKKGKSARDDFGGSRRIFYFVVPSRRRSTDSPAKS